jgi:hypothetical protein
VSEGTFARRPNDEKTYSPQFLRDLMVNPGSTADELRQLREEIKALREALTPPKSILIVGADVERILREIKND